MQNTKTLLHLTFRTLCLALPLVAHADSTLFLRLDSNFSSPDYSFYSYTDTFGAQQDSIPIGPYITFLTGDGYSNTLAYTFCYDFNSPTNVGTPYGGSLVSTISPSDPDYNAAMQASFLINKLNALGMLNAPLAQRGAISLAIWEIMNASSTTGLAQFPTDPAAQPYEAQAAAAVANGSWTQADAALYPMWVPDDPSIQRFGMVFQGESAVPEPASLVLLPVGILALAVMGRRLKRSTHPTML